MLRIDTAFEAKRQEMVTVGMALGLSHPRTVALSQELDKLLNQYDKEDKPICQVQTLGNPWHKHYRIR